MAEDRIYTTDDGCEPFRFNENVARVFPDMLRRSIPGYSASLEAIGSLLSSSILDIVLVFIALLIVIIYWTQNNLLFNNLERTWIVAEIGGYATLIRAEPAVRAAVDVFQPLDSGAEVLTRGIKSAFDPAGILNPGRMYPGI